MKEHADMSVSAQEREAYSDDRMKEQIKAVRNATYNYERLRFKREVNGEDRDLENLSRQLKVDKTIGDNMSHLN